MKVLVQMDMKSRTRFLRDREICKKKSLSGDIPDGGAIFMALAKHWNYPLGLVVVFVAKSGPT
jgi:hypothetical protein